MTHKAITFTTISNILDTLDGMMSKGFGPNALSSLLSTSTGKIMITSDGMSILQALNISHPIGQMVIKCIKQHQFQTGDNSKTFLIMLAGVSKWLEKEEAKGLSSKQIRPIILNGLKIIKHVFIPRILIPGLLETGMKTDFCDQNRGKVLLQVKHLVSTSAQGLFDMGTRRHLSKLVCDYVFYKDTKVEQIRSVIHDAVNNFNEMCLESPGACFISSKVVDGFVIQRNFMETAPWKKSKNERVKFVLINFPLEGIGIEHQIVVNVKNKQDLIENRQSVKRKIWSHVQKLSSKGVNLIVSQFKISDITAYFCKENGIAVLQVVDGMDILRLANLCGLVVLHEPEDLHLPNIVGTAENCSVMSIGRESHVCLQHVWVEDPAMCARQIIVYGSSPGVCKQYSVQILNSFKILRNWLQDGFQSNYHCQNSQMSSQCLTVCSNQYGVNSKETKSIQHSINDENLQNNDVLKSCRTIPGGGAFELYVCHLLNKFKKESDDQSVQITIEMLQSAYFTVPLRLISNSYQPESEKIKIADLHLLAEKQNTKICGVNAKFGNGLLTDSTIVHPLYSKVLLMYHFIECLEQLVRTDSIVSVQRLNHT